MSASIEVKVSLDLDVAKKHLSYLGYAENDKVPLRFFFPSDDPRKEGDKGRVLTTFDPEKITQHQVDGRGVYVVVNGRGGARKDKEVTHTVGVFCEWDNLPEEEQQRVWSDRGFLEPSFMIRSGGKSIHAYWLFDEALTDIDEWKRLQGLLIEKLGADAANKNPSRVFRLAGGHHISKKGVFPTEFIHESGARYSVATLQEGLSALTTPVICTRDTFLRFLTLSDKHVVLHGKETGSRHTRGVALSNNIVGTHQWLIDKGVWCHFNPHEVFLEYCEKCDSTDWLSSEWDSIWNAALSAPRSPSLAETQLIRIYNSYLGKSEPLMSAESRAKFDESRRASEWSVESNDGEEILSYSPTDQFTQKAFSTLYGNEGWISVQGRLYQWQGTYYKLVQDDIEKRRIAEFLNALPKFSKDGKPSYPYARPGKVDECLKWAKQRLAVSVERVNPPGINCTNGVLQVLWEGKVPHWKLVPHDPDVFYLYEPMATYDPEASDADCARLLECLEPEQQAIFLKTIAASLDLAKVREYKGRKIKALLMRGTGSNGKDALRKVVEMLYGKVGLTSCSINDFAMYDQGRKFPLARLAVSKVNWASENATFARLDKLPSLKSFITGDNLVCEKKGQDEIEIQPQAIGIFNINENPNIIAAQKAITSRYAILSFDKTYSEHPKPGELEADPRFKYDDTFIQTAVLPAFLNRVLKALYDLMVDDIDYSSTIKALEEAQEEACHLYGFIKDSGLSYGDATLTAKDIWEPLRQWYIDNGTLSVEVDLSGKEQLTWSDPAKPSDKPIKGLNQVIPRMLELFPKAKRISQTNPKTRRKQPAISGLCFSFPQPPPDADDDGPTPSPPPSSPPDNSKELSAPSTSPTNPYECTRVGAEIVEVDKDKLSLAYVPDNPITPWEPSTQQKPYEECSVVALDIETTGLDPEDCRVISVGFKDQLGTTKLICERDEKNLLMKVCSYMSEGQWDILIGHNIFGFDFPFLTKRCRRYKITPPWRTSDHQATITSAAIFGEPIKFYPVFLGKTQIIDTFHQAGIYDKQFATLLSYRLKDLAIFFGGRKERRLELDHREINHLWEQGTVEPILEYLKYDLDDTLFLGEFFVPTIYYQAAVVPLPIQKIGYVSPAKKWQSILEEHYGGATGVADEKLSYEGAFTSCNPGLYQNVAKIDVSSMYPSIQLRYGLCSKKDHEQFYLKVLSYLTKTRLEMKAALKGDLSEEERLRLNAMQNAFKILINGGYGFSGTGHYSFNCMETAVLVTAYGRLLIMQMIEEAQRLGATIIEVDTDGIIFASAEPERICSLVQASLPEGISIGLDWDGYTTYVPKTKNYLLIDDGGKVKRKGFFRKRNRFQLEREFPERFIKAYLSSPETGDQLYQATRDRLMAGGYPIEELTIREKISTSAKKLLRLGKPKEIVTYYWGEESRVDSNGRALRPERIPVTRGAYSVSYYVDKLDSLHQELMQTITKTKTS